MSFLADDKEKLPVPDEGPMKILIGPENVSDALKDTSVVVASYDIGDDMRGLIGVVGPTRMDYAAVAATADRLCRRADKALRQAGKTGITPEGGYRYMSEETKEPVEETPGGGRKRGSEAGS